MNWIRLVLNTALISVITKLNLPLEGASDAVASVVDIIAQGAAITASWIVIRYILPKLPAELAEKFSTLTCFALLCGFTCLLMSCASPVTTTIDYGDAKSGMAGTITITHNPIFPTTTTTTDTVALDETTVVDEDSSK